jgi:hypothetical protein
MSACLCLCMVTPHRYNLSSVCVCECVSVSECVSACVRVCVRECLCLCLCLCMVAQHTDTTCLRICVASRRPTRGCSQQCHDEVARWRWSRSCLQVSIVRARLRHACRLQSVCCCAARSIGRPAVHLQPCSWYPRGWYKCWWRGSA